MNDQKTLEELIKNLREKVAEYSIAIIDLETLLGMERTKSSELQKQLDELSTDSKPQEDSTDK